MLQLYFSNRADRLIDLLLDHLGEAPPSPFEAEELVVPSAAMGRFIELRYADRFGVAANLSLSFPAQWIWRQIAKSAGVPVGESPLSAEVLTWYAYGWLCAEAPKPGTRLNSYLKRSDAGMRFELASRIARRLEHYVT